VAVALRAGADPCDTVRVRHLPLLFLSGTFQLADDGEDGAPRTLLAALRERPEKRFWVLGFGERRDVPGD
jgi:hypothetical protein